MRKYQVAMIGSFELFILNLYVWRLNYSSVKEGQATELLGSHPSLEETCGAIPRAFSFISSDLQ